MTALPWHRAIAFALVGEELDLPATDAPDPARLASARTALETAIDDEATAGGGLRTSGRDDAHVIDLGDDRDRAGRDDDGRAESGDLGAQDQVRERDRARAAALSMIPTSTGAAKAVGLVLPELKGKLDGVAIRVPTPNVSVVDLTFEASRDTSVEEINAAIKAAADGPMRGILGYTEEPLVSSDFNHDPHSSVFHIDQTKVMEGRLCRILTWYDNEWGFSNRMLDTTLAFAAAK